MDKAGAMRVYICSPRACDYSRAASELGVTPVAPQLVDDTPQDGLELLARCDELWICTRQITNDMDNEIAAARQLRIPVRRFYAKRKEISQPLYSYFM